MSRKIGALWLKETKDGKKYMSGVLEDIRGEIRIAVFRNDRKEKDNHPDYQVSLSVERKDRSESDQATDSTVAVDLSDIPF